MPARSYPTDAPWSDGTLTDLAEVDEVLVLASGKSSGQWLSPVIQATDFVRWVRQVLRCNIPECASVFFFVKSSDDPDDLDDWSGDVEAPGDWLGPFDAEDQLGVIDVNLRVEFLRASAESGEYLRFVVVLEGE
jgi:hypothetical protein